MPYGIGGYGRGGYGSTPIKNNPWEYYSALITSEYRSSPKFMQFVGVILQMIGDINDCAASFDTAFHLDYAVGAQLDILGQIAGISRTLPFQPSNGVSPVLVDADYRILLKAIFARNLWSGSKDDLQTIWQQLFPGGKIVVTDNQSMSATILLTGKFSSVIIDLIKAGYIVPRPAGVLYNYVLGTLPVFGFDVNNQYIAGFDQGHFS